MTSDKNDGLVFLVKVHKNYDKKNKEFYRFVINLKSDVTTPCFVSPMSKLPADINILEEYIQQTLVVYFDPQ